MGAKASVLAQTGCKYLGRLYSDMDCQKFVETALRDAGITKDLAGSNAWYRMMTWVGTPAECKAKFGSIPVGAFLYILSNNGKEPEKYKKDGIGNASHIGIYTAMTGAEMVAQALADGNVNGTAYNFGNGAIHSSSSRAHVCTSAFAGKAISGGWNRIGLWDKIDYGEHVNAILRGESPSSIDPDDPVPTPEPAPVVTVGKVYAEAGRAVKMRQKPSSKCNLYWDVPIGETVEILGEGEWDHIRWNGRTGYMKSDYIMKGDHPSDEPTPPSGDDSADPGPSFAIVWADNGSTVKMRQKPSTSCRLYDKVPIGTKVTVNEKGDDWTRVSYQNRKGWYIMTQYLKFDVG